MAKEEFLASDVTKITDVKLNRLQPWLKKGWITPSIRIAEGHGTRNIFSREDLYCIALFKKLVEGGVFRDSAAPAMNFKTLSNWVKGERLELWLIVSRNKNDCKLFLPTEPYMKRRGPNDPDEGSGDFKVDTGGELLRIIADYFEGGSPDVMIIDLPAIIKEVDQKIDQL